jgi:hypothetical protein
MRQTSAPSQDNHWPFFGTEKTFRNTGQLKKKVTLSYGYNEVTSEPTITRYTTIVRKTLNVLICYLTNTQCGNPVSHTTRQSDSPFLSRLSPACPCLWLPQRRWCARPHTVRLVSLGVCKGRRLRTIPAKRSSRIETEHHRRCGNHKQGHAGENLDRNRLSDWRVPCDTGLPHWVFVRQHIKALRAFLTIDAYLVIVGSLVTLLQTCESVTFFFNCPVILRLSGFLKGQRPETTVLFFQRLSNLYRPQHHHSSLLLVYLLGESISK